MRVGPASKVPGLLPMLAAAAVTLMTVQVNAQTTLEIGIGTQIRRPIPSPAASC
jgi:NitT/TauT family transport system substrate-binding protein